MNLVFQVLFIMTMDYDSRPPKDASFDGEKSDIYKGNNDLQSDLGVQGKEGAA